MRKKRFPHLFRATEPRNPNGLLAVVAMLSVCISVN